MGLLFCFLGAISFGLLGCASKGAERSNCNASGFVVSVCGWATLMMLIRSALLKSGSHMPLKAIAVAVACGVCAAVAYLAFQNVHPNRQGDRRLVDDESLGRRPGCRFDLEISREVDNPKGRGVFAGVGVDLFHVLGSEDRGACGGKLPPERRLSTQCGFC